MDQSAEDREEINLIHPSAEDPTANATGQATCN